MACERWSKCYHALNWLFLPKPGFFGIYLNFFSSRNHLKNQYLPHFESKSYQINSIKSCSSRSFQQHQRHIPIPPKCSVKKSFNIQKLLHHKSKRREPNPCTPPHQELSKDTKNTIWSIPSPCTSPRRELSKDTKNTIWSILVQCIS